MIMKNIIGFLSCEWLSNFVDKALDYPKKKGFFWKLIIYFALIIVLYLIGMGLMMFFGFFYGLSEALGIYYGVFKFLIVVVVPMVICYILHHKPWFWFSVFLVGLTSIIYLIAH